MKKAIAFIIAVVVIVLGYSGTNTDVSEDFSYNIAENKKTESQDNTIYDSITPDSTVANYSPTDELIKADTGTNAISADESKEIAYNVYRTKTGSKYHSYGCQYLYDSCIELDIADALSRGLESCSVCQP